MGKTSKAKRDPVTMVENLGANTSDALSAINRRLDDIVGAFPTIDKRLTELSTEFVETERRVDATTEQVIDIGRAFPTIENRLMGLEAASRERVENEQALQRRVAKLAADGGEYYKLINAQANEHAMFRATVGEMVDGIRAELAVITGRVDARCDNELDLVKRIEFVSERVDNAFENIGAHNEALADIVNRIAVLEAVVKGANNGDRGVVDDVDLINHRVTALENQIRELNRGLPMLKPAKSEPKPSLREVSEEAVHYAANCLGTVGVLRALADYLIAPYLQADSEEAAQRVKDKRRIINEAIEKVEGL